MNEVGGQKGKFLRREGHHTVTGKGLELGEQHCCGLVVLEVIAPRPVPKRQRNEASQLARIARNDLHPHSVRGYNCLSRSSKHMLGFMHFEYCRIYFVFVCGTTKE